jgi:hypothetical protein
VLAPEEQTDLEPDLALDEAPEEAPEDEFDQEAFDELMAGYWAGQEGDKLINTLLEKENAYFAAISDRGIDQVWRLCYAQMYGLDRSGGTLETQSIQFAGEDGELLQFRINEFASYANQIVSMATKNRPSFQCQAINDDAKSANQIESSDAITTYYYEQVYGERKERATVEADVHFGKAWTLIDWDEEGGRDLTVMEPGPIDPLTGAPGPEVETQVKSGEMVMQRFFPWHVIHEPLRSEYDGHVWRMTKQRKSRWEMMARHPRFAAKIKDCPPEEENFVAPGHDFSRGANDDDVVVRTFYHARTAALPTGRKVIFVGKTAVNGQTGNGVDLPIEEIPLIDLMSQEMIGTSFGYAAAWDWLAINQMLDQITSDIATNVECFGRPTIMMTETADVDLDALADGKRVLWLPPGLETPPTALQINAVPELSLKLAEYLHSRLQSLSGLNSVARGNPDANISSGEMAALFNAIAIEFQSARQAALDIHRERVANIQLQYLKKYALLPQMVAIAGDDERAYLQEFKADDLEGVHRVVVKTASPMLRSQSGRMQLAEFLMKIPGVVANPEQIIELVVSGRWKPLYKVTRQSLLRINAENQKLREGPQVTEQTGQPGPDGMPVIERFIEDVPVMITDDHKAHLIEHASVLSSPAALANPAIVDAVYAHNEEHMRLWRTGDPHLAMMLGHTPPPPPPGMEGMTPEGGPPKPGGAPDAQSAKQASAVAQEPTDKPGPKLPGVSKPAQTPGPAQQGLQ